MKLATRVTKISKVNNQPRDATLPKINTYRGRESQSAGSNNPTPGSEAPTPFPSSLGSTSGEIGYPYDLKVRTETLEREYARIRRTS